MVVVTNHMKSVIGWNNTIKSANSKERLTESGKSLFFYLDSSPKTIFINITLLTLKLIVITHYSL